MMLMWIDCANTVIVMVMLVKEASSKQQKGVSSPSSKTVPPPRELSRRINVHMMSSEAICMVPGGDTDSGLLLCSERRFSAFSIFRGIQWGAPHRQRKRNRPNHTSRDMKLSLCEQFAWGRSISP